MRNTFRVCFPIYNKKIQCNASICCFNEINAITVVIKQNKAVKMFFILFYFFLFYNYCLRNIILFYFIFLIFYRLWSVFCILTDNSMIDHNITFFIMFLH